MKVKAFDGSKIPVILELEEYDRQYGSRIYPVVPAHNLADYERGIEYKLSLSTRIATDGFLNRPEEFGDLNIQNPEVENIIKKHLKDLSMLL